MRNEFRRREFDRDFDFRRRRGPRREHRLFRFNHYPNRYSHSYWDNFYDDIFYG